MVVYAFNDRHPLVRRLSKLHELSAMDERALLNKLGPPQKVRKGQDIVSDGSVPHSVSIVVSGVACRYKMLSDGQRQILGFLLPGDMADDWAGSSTPTDHNVGAATDCVIE